MTRWTLDLETTTDHKTIRVGGLWTKGGPVHFFTSRLELEKVLRYVSHGDAIWTWNGSGFDCDILKKVWAVDLPSICLDKGVFLRDGFILAKMLYPDMLGGHSLDNFSKKYIPRYTSWKPDSPDWYNTASMMELTAYLGQDLEYTLQVVDGLNLDIARIGGKWAHGLKVEQRVREITNEQVDDMVKFNVTKAEDLWCEIDREMKTIESNLESWLPTLLVKKPKPPPKKQFKADGTLSAHMERYLNDFGFGQVLERGGRIVTVTDGKAILTLPLTDPLPQWEKVSLGSQTRLKEWLMEEGWKPTWWNTKKEHGKTVKTSPRLNHAQSKEPCPDLKRFGSHGEDISRWLMLRARRSLLANESFSTGLIPRAKAKGGFIASDADTIGTNTARWRHKGIVNIPRVSSAYGREFRELFCAREGMRWVGWDASSLEACIEAHYTYKFDKDYAMALVQGDSSKGTDVHSRNMKALGLPDRDMSKTFKYATTYGAQPPSLAEQLGVPVHQAERYFEDFWTENVGLRKLKDELYREWVKYDKKYIVGLDGRLIATRSEHSLINTKFQSGGAIVMKHAMLIAHKRIKEYAARENFEAYGLIRYHDEEQWETDGNDDQCSMIGQLGINSITQAGKFLKLNVPLTGEYKVGNNWAETH